MINIFSIVIASIIFAEILIVFALIKPVKQPGNLRDFWCSILDKINHPEKVVAFILSMLFMNTMMQISWEKSCYKDLLIKVNDPDLELKFIVSKISLCYTLFVVVVFLFITIERLFQYLLTVARLLEFELMCRHSIMSNIVTTEGQRHSQENPQSNNVAITATGQ